MNINIIMNQLHILSNIIIFLFAIIAIYMILEQGLQFICSYNTAENFVNDYYKWDWNNPNIIKYMNLYTDNNSCSTCTYSQSCHLTDDAQPFCYKSQDIPSYSKNILINNSF